SPQLPAAPTPARPAPRRGGDLPFGGRRLRRDAVRAGLVVAGAVALALSYPPFHFPLLGVLAVAPAVLLLRWCEGERSPQLALRWGFWYGFVAQGVVLYWLVVALWHFTPLSALGYLATIAVYGLWYATLFWLVVKLRLERAQLPVWRVLTL